jgi:hypothetical protein
MTPQELAKAYAKTITGPANGWGQHAHSTLGLSDFIMLRIRELVGEQECDRLIDQELAELGQ